ncbi:MAG: M24 family metallopeptidase [Phycisphaerales bacterium]|nr:M24 family metallopeptidase [Phycisphaerales bacterium]
MSIVLHDEGEIAAIARSASLACTILHEMIGAARPGVTPAALRALAGESLSRAGAMPPIGIDLPSPRHAPREDASEGGASSSREPVVLGVHRARNARHFLTLHAHAACASGRDDACDDEADAASHLNEPFSAGELVTLDLALCVDGWHSDMARCGVIARSVHDASERRARDPIAFRLVDAAHACTSVAVSALVPGARWSDVARAIRDEAEACGVRVIDTIPAGHGIGRRLHEPPALMLGAAEDIGGRADFELRPGMVLCIEPVVALLQDPASEEHAPTDHARTDRSPAELADRSDCPMVAFEEAMVAITRAGPRRLDVP